MLIELAAAVLGASAQEILYWYGVREQLAKVAHKRKALSPGYWGITLLMIALSTGGTFVFLWNNTTASPWVYLVVAAAFPLILKQAIAAIRNQPQRNTLGTDWSSDYFGPSRPSA